MRPENTRIWRKGLRRSVRTHPRLARPAPIFIGTTVHTWLEREAGAENETQPAKSDAEA